MCVHMHAAAIAARDAGGAETERAVVFGELTKCVNAQNV